MVAKSALPLAAARPASAFAGLRQLFGLYRQRRQLGRLDDALLEDIGVTREGAEAEAARPVWDVPQHWRA